MILKQKADKIKSQQREIAFNKKYEEIREQWRKKIEQVRASDGPLAAKRFVKDLAPTLEERQQILKDQAEEEFEKEQ